jgi:glycosyltransferase involved in cell wall biosynthesis
MNERLVMVTPVYNEASNIVRTAEAVAAQTRRPDLWIVVDDGSSDGTLELIAAFAAEHPWMRVLSAPQRPEEADSVDKLALAKEARAFNWGLAQAGEDQYTHVGKLDGDVELPPRYFETLLGRFAADPTLGLAGGTLEEIGPNGWRRLNAPEYHVHGAMKLFSRACFESVGGIEERLGWDTIDETYARMRGFRTRSFDDIRARHHRPWGSADGRLRGSARIGECAYVVRYSLPWVLLRTVKVMAARPYVLAGVWFLGGYVGARIRNRPKHEDEEFRRFVRRELRARLLPARLRPTTDSGSF